MGKANGVFRQQPVLAEEPGILQHLEVGQIAEGLEPEVAQEVRCGNIGIGCSRRRQNRDCACRVALWREIAGILLALGTYRETELASVSR